MRIISFDTSSQAIHLCLMEDGAVVTEKIISPVNPKHANRQELATSLLPALTSSLADKLWNKTSLKAIVVGRGPGSFTGIRGAVTIARTLAYALKLPLLGLSRFEVITSYFEGPAGVILSAYREFCYVSVLELASNKPTSWIMEPRCIAQTELAPMLKYAGQNFGVSSFIADKSLIGIAGVLLKPIPAINNLASRQAEIAWNRLSLKRGNPDDVLADDFPWKLVEPLYLREPSVTLLKS